VNERLTSAEARSQFAEVLNKVAYRGVRVVVTKHNKEVAAVIPIADLERLALLDQSIDLEEAQAAIKDAEERGYISLAALKAELRK
jgi:prevent-host-death family protein